MVKPIEVDSIKKPTQIDRQIKRPIVKRPNLVFENKKG